jgi:hypothetical protein
MLVLETEIQLASHLGPVQMCVGSSVTESYVNVSKSTKMLVANWILTSADM